MTSTTFDFTFDNKRTGGGGPDPDDNHTKVGRFYCVVSVVCVFTRLAVIVANYFMPSAVTLLATLMYANFISWLFFLFLAINKFIDTAQMTIFPQSQMSVAQTAFINRMWYGIVAVEILGYLAVRF